MLLENLVLGMVKNWSMLIEHYTILYSILLVINYSFLFFLCLITSYFFMWFVILNRLDIRCGSSFFLDLLN